MYEEVCTDFGVIGHRHYKTRIIEFIRQILGMLTRHRDMVSQIWPGGCKGKALVRDDVGKLDLSILDCGYLR